MTQPIDELESDLSDVKDQATEALQSAAGKTPCVVEQGRQYVRANPLPVFFGALAAGIVIGMLLPACKSTPRTRALDDRIDDLKDLLATIGAKVSATAEDRYEGVSSAIGSAVKKAKKRFNLS